MKEERKGFCSAVHAEKNAFNQCSRYGVSAQGASLYTTNFPCPGCARDVIVPNGVREIVVLKDYLENPLLTMDEYRVSEYWLGQAKIPVRKLDFSEERLKELLSTLLVVGNRSEYRFRPRET